MIKYCVIYYGKPEDPAAFDDYYWTHHLPLVTRWPKLKRLAVSKGQPGDEIYQIAEIHFENREDLDVALHSPERAVTGQDLKNFPKFNGEIKRQIFEEVEYYRA